MKTTILGLVLGRKLPPDLLNTISTGPRGSDPKTLCFRRRMSLWRSSEAEHGSAEHRESRCVLQRDFPCYGSAIQRQSSGSSDSVSVHHRGCLRGGTVVVDWRRFGSADCCSAFFDIDVPADWNHGSCFQCRAAEPQPDGWHWSGFVLSFLPLATAALIRSSGERGGLGCGFARSGACASVSITG